MNSDSLIILLTHAGIVNFTPGTLPPPVQTSRQIGQAVASGALRIGDATEMAPGREVLAPTVRCESIDPMLEATERHKTQRLRENRLDVMHHFVAFAKRTGNDTGRQPLAISSRRNQQ